MCLDWSRTKRAGGQGQWGEWGHPWTRHSCFPKWAAPPLCKMKPPFQQSCWQDCCCSFYVAWPAHPPSRQGWDTLACCCSRVWQEACWVHQQCEKHRETLRELIQMPGIFCIHKGAKSKEPNWWFRVGHQVILEPTNHGNGLWKWEAQPALIQHFDKVLYAC